jgi:hypothetical protein
MLEFAVLPLGNVGKAGSRGLHQYLLNAQSCLVKHFLQKKSLKVSYSNIICRTKS